MHKRLSSALKEKLDSLLNIAFLQNEPSQFARDERNADDTANVEEFRRSYRKQHRQLSPESACHLLDHMSESMLIGKWRRANRS